MRPLSTAPAFPGNSGCLPQLPLRVDPVQMRSAGILPVPASGTVPVTGILLICGNCLFLGDGLNHGCPFHKADCVLDQLGGG